VLLESADVIGTYVDPDRAWALVAEAAAIGPSSSAERTYLELFRGEAHLRCGRAAEAAAAFALIPPDRHTATRASTSASRLLALRSPS